MPAHIRIKVCGITRPEDALAAARLGADAIGLVFCAGSARQLDIAQARRIIAVLPPFVTPVALFADTPLAEREAVLQEIPCELLQFHGAETAVECERHARPYVKALWPGRVDWGLEAATRYAGAAALLVDCYDEERAQGGGGGKPFDWSLLATSTPSQPLILAGGLNADNVATALQQLRPWAVDVSSGVEETPGIKSTEKMAAFIDAVRSTEAQWS